jgi:hypothetical protein
MASREASQRQPPAPDDSVAPKRFACVLGAARLKTAGGGQERPQQQLVAPHDTAGNLRSQAHAPALAAGWACAISARNSLIDASRAHARATKTASRPRICGNPSPRYASRILRRARLRRTAPRICRLTAKPTRAGPPRGTHRSTNARRSSRRPCWKTAWISLACLKRASRGSPSAPTARLTTAPLDGETLASLGASPLENFPSTGSLHPLTEAMCLLPAASVRLVRPLHGGTPSVGR